MFLLKMSLLFQRFFSTVRQVVHEMDLERKQDPKLDFNLERLKQKKVKDFDHLNFFTRDEIADSEKEVWI